MLGDDLAVALPEMRAAAESRMRSRVRVEQVVVAADLLTGHDVESVTTVADGLRCRLRQRDTLRNVEGKAGGATVPVQSTELHVPWDTPGLRVGMRAVVTVSESPLAVGQVYRLVRRPEGDQITAQRWGVESWA